MIKIITIILFSLFLAGCDARYRYPCQDPANWGTERCTKPVCEVNHDCPEQIFNKKIVECKK
jgi:hypothetical protein